MLSLLLPGRHSETGAAASALRPRLGPEQALPEPPALIVGLVIVLRCRQAPTQHSRMSVAAYHVGALAVLCKNLCGNLRRLGGGGRQQAD